MRIDDDAKEWLERTIVRALGPHAAPAAQYEALGHLHAVAERVADAGGRDAVSLDDARRAVRDAGGEAGIAVAFAGAPPRGAGLPRRAAAHALDLLVVYGGILAAWALVFLGFALVGGSGSVIRPDPFQFVDWDDLPWNGGVGAPPVALATNLLLGLLVLAAPVFYFAWFESRHGWTPGKKALDLRVRQVVGAGGRAAGGGGVGFGRALVRSLPKALPLAPLLALDALLWGQRRQRGTDRIADTLVVAIR